LQQERFARLIAELITWAFANGYTVTLGDAFRDPRVFGPLGVTRGYGKPASRHKLRLACDLNLFRDGRYLDGTEAHRPLGEHWEKMGGTWGGRSHDGNHYELSPEPCSLLRS
jgi:hypothetical protein